MATDLEKLVVQLSADVRGYERALAKAKGTTDRETRAIENRFQKMNKNIQTSFGGLDRTVKSFAAGFIGAFGVQQFAQIARQVAAVGDAIGDLADQTGATVESIQILRYAAQQTGSSVEQMDKALAKFAVNLGEAQRGSGQLAKLLEANGVALKDAAGNARSFNDILDDVVDLVQRAPDQFSKLEVVTTAFGMANDELVTTLSNGRAGIDAYGDRLRALGGVMDRDGVDALGRLDAKFNDATISMEAAIKRLVVATGPMIEGILNEIAQFARDLETISATIDLLLQGKFARASRVSQYGPETAVEQSINERRELEAQMKATLQDQITLQGEINTAIQYGALSKDELIAKQEELNDLLEKEKEIERQIAALPRYDRGPMAGRPGQAPAAVSTGGATVIPAGAGTTDDVKDAAKATEDAAEEFKRAMDAGSDFAKSLADVPDQWQKLFYEAGRAFGVDPNLLASVAWKESHFDPSAIGPMTKYGTAKGMMQFIDPTAAQFGINAMVPEQAVPAAAKYFSQLLDKYQGDVVLALMAYNWGPGNVDKWIAAGMQPGKVPAETRGYVAAITTATPGIGETFTTFEEQQKANEALRHQADWDRYLADMQTATDALTAQMDALRSSAEGVFSTIIDGLRNGASAGEIFQAVLSQILDDLAAAASRSLTSALFGGYGTTQTGLLGSLFGGLFGAPAVAGARQHGGPVMGGSSYLVGEHGPEVFTPSVAGAVLPNSRGQRVGVAISSHVAPSPFFIQTLTAITDERIAANNRMLPGYLAERQRRGV